MLDQVIDVSLTYLSDDAESLLDQMFTNHQQYVQEHISGYF